MAKKRERRDKFSGLPKKMSLSKKRKHYSESSRTVVREIAGRKVVEKDVIGYYDPCPVEYRRPTELEVRAKQRSEQSLIEELKKLLAQPKYNKNHLNVTNIRKRTRTIDK